MPNSHFVMLVPGGYDLTSVYASLCLIQSKPEVVPSSGLTREARDSLKDWSRRRSLQAQSQKNLRQQLVRLNSLIY